MAASPEEKLYDHLRERYTTRRVMKIFGISRTTLRRWVADGLIRAVRIGPRQIEFEKDEVERRYHVCRGDRSSEN